jgi:hypothetical protein
MRLDDCLQEHQPVSGLRWRLTVGSVGCAAMIGRLISHGFLHETLPLFCPRGSRMSANGVLGGNRRPSWPLAIWVKAIAISGAMFATTLHTLLSLALARALVPLFCQSSRGPSLMGRLAQAPALIIGTQAPAPWYTHPPSLPYSYPMLIVCVAMYSS